MVHLRRIDAARNMARFYVMTVQPTLFGAGGRLVSNSFAGDTGLEPASLLHHDGREYTKVHL
jgi:hypothetical protein